MQGCSDAELSSEYMHTLLVITIWWPLGHDETATGRGAILALGQSLSRLRRF